VSFRLSKRSRDRLDGVSLPLIEVVELAIQLTRVDFGVIEGVRTAARQRELVASGASQTMRSRHLTGDAVDVMAYVGNRGSWESALYAPIADAFKAAGQSLGVPLRWGGAWTVRDLTLWPDTAEDAMWSYVAERREQGRRPFLDLGHFELA
jgi:peptidoglycan L-alanyl-D-glutamate endopeptidase CwlK